MPTYDERENLRGTLSGIRWFEPQVDVLVVDDSSPDGTGDLADEMAHADGHIHVLHRREKQGLGPAYLAGFEWALQRGYDIVCEMDMDGSHRPADLVRLLDAMRRDRVVDLVIGSRRVRSGGTQGWPWYRDLISRGGSWYARAMLGVGVRDMTAGFRAYRAPMLRRVTRDVVRSNGYVFQIDMTRRVAAEGGRVVEVPILFMQRTRGRSKMDSEIVREAMVRVTQWGLERRFTGRAGEKGSSSPRE
ncbi:polyprenol monophosphomannose synthase [uncultured Bifidobacterium sp.]|uniref:polyprenol monophosphomannose synthase n=1 Tax=uncultured Bifidobacterium sp. TaxID=165187 RepID=UPI00260915A7|nr:polyprenol monophosphomannose synthase [uncultured Bifidobacterium sp.]